MTNHSDPATGSADHEARVYPDAAKLAEKVLLPGYFHFRDPKLLPQRADEVRTVARAFLYLQEVVGNFICEAVQFDRENEEIHCRICHNSAVADGSTSGPDETGSWHKDWCFLRYPINALRAERAPSADLGVIDRERLIAIMTNYIRIEYSAGGTEIGPPEHFIVGKAQAADEILRVIAAAQGTRTAEACQHIQGFPCDFCGAVSSKEALRTTTPQDAGS